jgi:hypothetical protein
MSSEKNRDNLYANLTAAGIWLRDNLGEAHKTLALHRGATDDILVEINDFLFAKLKELLEEDFRIVNSMTWAEGPGYEVLALSSTMAIDDYEHDHHDMVVVIHDDLLALQFKLSIG